MIRQAHTYMVSAMSGAVLIALAIAVFVVLVSVQVFRDWPIAGLGDSGGSAGISDARAALSSAATASGSAAKSASAAAAAGAGNAAGKTKQSAADLAAVNDGGAAPAGTGVTEGGETGSNGGSGNSTPTPGTNSPSPTAGSQSSGPGGGSSSSSGSGSSAASTPSAKVTETVNNTVNQVDETALGGTLNNSGVTEVTEGVVNGVVGPESTVGKVVDETVGTVGGLLHPNH